MKLLNTRIIILDDDFFVNTLCVLSLKRMFPNIHLDILGFTNPEEGLQYIESSCAEDCRNTVLLLDINMPVLNGWEVLERLERLPTDIVNQLTVYILSSSIDPRDVEKSEESALIKAYLVKPLTDHLSYIFRDIEDEELAASADDLLIYNNDK